MRIMRAVAAGAVLAATMGSGVAVAAPELGVSDRLQDRRALVSGDRAYSVGFEDGRFYANGWHITGEMGGVWTPPIKLVDGVWFGVGDQWVGPATEFRSGWGYTRMKLPDTGGMKLERTDFAPDGGRAVLFGLKLSNPASAAKSVDRQGRQPLRAAGRVPVGVRRRGAERERQPRGHGVLRRPLAGVPGAGQAAAPERGGARLGSPGGLGSPTGGRRDRRRATEGIRATPGVRRRTGRRRRARATTARSARARAASCATTCASRAMTRRRCGSPSPAPTRASAPPVTSSPRR